jgi:hypothetical protein
MSDQIQQLINDLIDEGDSVAGSKWKPHGNWLGGAPTYVNFEKLSSWKAKCQYLAHQIGKHGTNWEEILSDSENSLANVWQTLGVLKAARDLGAKRLLFKVRELVSSEILESLVDQANYLQSKGFFLASGVIYRAVLEQHLRDICANNDIELEKEKPTLGDFVSTLYKVERISRSEMKWLDSLASIGNDAAHNKPELKEEDVIRLGNDIPSVLTRIA